MNKYDDTDYLIEREESIIYEEGSDINVGSIEKDIKRCEELIKPEHANWIGISNQTAIAHLIERIQELEEENYVQKVALLENSVPKQKVKDKLSKNRNELFSITYLDKKQYEPYEKQIERINKIEKESLEDK